MRNEVRGFLLVIAVVIFASVAFSMATPLSSGLATPSSTQTRTFTVTVSRDGFNGTSGVFDITVQQGDHVKITFVYGENDLSFDNPHAIAIDGYGVRTTNIGRSNPTVTVEFVANEPGTFKFYCYIPCVGMGELQGGRLIVEQGQTSGIATVLSLTVSGPGSSEISAKVEDVNGKPLSGIDVSFYENTTFGKLFLKTASTNSLGVATFDYATLRSGTVEIVAEYQGDPSYKMSSNVILIKAPSNGTNAENNEPTYFGINKLSYMPTRFYGIPFPSNLSMMAVPEETNILTVILAGIVIIGVWSTYAYVGRQIFGLPERGASQKEKNKGSVPSSETPPSADRTVPPEALELSDRTLALLLLVPLLGVANVLLVNSLEPSLLWRAMSLVGVAVVEALGVVATVNVRVRRT